MQQVFTDYCKGVEVFIVIVLKATQEARAMYYMQKCGLQFTEFEEESRLEMCDAYKILDFWGLERALLQAPIQ